MVMVSRSRMVARRTEAWIPTPLPFAAAFGAYLVVGAVLSAVSPPHSVGMAAMLAVAMVTGWFGNATGALSVAAMGWFFYSGFVAHAHAQLGVTGLNDLYIALALIIAAIAASTVHTKLRRREATVRVPTPRYASR